MLQFQSVSLALGSTDILTDVSFTVSPGELVAIIGASGAGKSSIFRLLTGQRRPTVGQLTVDKFDLGRLTPRSLQAYRRQIGVVFQDFKLLNHKTVAENVAFALEVCADYRDVDTRVESALRFTGLYPRRDAFPPTLSGGEKQRTAIARALVHQPRILIADEPTGNLDPRSSRIVGDLFHRLNSQQGLTTIFSTHDPLLVRQLRPRVIRLESGRIVFDRPDCDPTTAFQGLL